MFTGLCSYSINSTEIIENILKSENFTLLQKPAIIYDG